MMKKMVMKRTVMMKAMLVIKDDQDQLAFDVGARILINVQTNLQIQG